VFVFLRFNCGLINKIYPSNDIIPQINIELAIGNAEPLWKKLTNSDEKKAILHCKEPYKADAVPAFSP
jgi:hypothetical protein